MGGPHPKASATPVSVSGYTEGKAGSSFLKRARRDHMWQCGNSRGEAFQTNQMLLDRFNLLKMGRASGYKAGAKLQTDEILEG